MAISKITAGKTVKYRAQIRKHGYKAQSKTFSTKSLAQEWIKNRTREIESGDAGLVDANTYTVSDLFKQYIEDKNPAKAKRAHLTWWEDRIGFMLLSKITSPMLRDYLRELAKGNKNLGGKTVRKGTKQRSPATVNRYQSSLSSVFAYGNDPEIAWMTRNPANFKQLGEADHITRWLSNGEREALLVACTDSQWDGLYPLVVMALTTAARQGNLLSLRWSDIDLKAGRVHINHTKAGEEMTLALTGSALIAMKQWSKARSVVSNLVFPSAKMPGKPYADFRKHWDIALEVAGIENFRFHDLRHTAGTYLAKSGANRATIMKAMNHKTLEASSRYLHMDVDDVAAAQEKAAAQFGL